MPTRGYRTNSFPALADERDEQTQSDTTHREERRMIQNDGGSEDLFLSLAQNRSEADGDEEQGSGSGSERHCQEAARKRKSMPEHAVLRSQPTARPWSSGYPIASTYAGSSFGGDGIQPHASRAIPSRTGSKHVSNRDSYATAGLDFRGGLRHDYTSARHLQANDALHERTRSPESARFGRRRLSLATSEGTFAMRTPQLSNHGAAHNLRRFYNAEIDSPLQSSHTPERKKSLPESDSVDSITAQSTVWDELDELKSRIKKLELTGKVPTTSGTAVSGQTNERPRTATTAPTTISSSPQHARKSAAPPSETTVGASGATGSHPLLHSALAKSKPLLSPSLYRALEATANDAVALATMTGGAGPQGTAYSAASIANGVAVSERQIRRKADSMCRNLTDLCIALCEGWTENTSSITKASPRLQQGETPPSRYMRQSSLDPEQRYTRSSPSRMLSRLEVRRSSALTTEGNATNSPRLTLNQGEEKSPNQGQKDYAAKYSRAGSSLLRSRHSRLEEDQEDDTVRAPSRAMTEINTHKPLSGRRREHSMLGEQRSPSLREVLAARRANADIAEEADNDRPYDSPSVPQEGSRRFLGRLAPAPPASDAGSSFSLSKKRRITSFEHFNSSPRTEDLPTRTASLHQRSNIVLD